MGRVVVRFLHDDSPPHIYADIYTPIHVYNHSYSYGYGYGFSHRHLSLSSYRYARTRR
jgi:hypothetical protein